VPRNVRVLPGPLELERSEFGGETVDDHLHHPRAALGRLPRAMGDLPVMLTCAASGEGGGSLLSRWTYRILLGGFGVLPMYVLGDN